MTETDSGWTFSTLKEHLEKQIDLQRQASEQRFNDNRNFIEQTAIMQEKAIQAALDERKEATRKVEQQTEARFQSVNEFRLALSDQTNSFIPRVEAEARIAANAEKVDVLRTDFEKRMSELKTVIDKNEGKGAGAQAFWGYLVGGIGIAIAIASYFR